MKQLLPPANATFNASGKTITFSTTIPATISHILSIVNTSAANPNGYTLLYQPQGGLAFSGTYASPVLTLNCSTVGMSNGDKLEIFYDDGIADGGSLTDLQLRANPVEVYATDFVLPTNAAQESGGNLEILASNVFAATGLPGSDVPAYGDIVAGKDSTGKLRTLSVDSAGVLDVAVEKIGADSLSLGQKAAATSIPVVLASDQNNAIETGGFLQSIAESEANSAGILGSDSPVGGKVVGGTDVNGKFQTLKVGTDRVLDVCIEKVADAGISLGQKAASASFPVILASDQNHAQETGGNLASIATNTAAVNATAGQPAPSKGELVGGKDISGNYYPHSVDTGGQLNVDLERVGDANITLGQKTQAASLPVVLASNQDAIEVISPMIISPLTTHKYNATGAGSSIQVFPGQWYAMTISVDSITAATSTASCTTVSGSRTMTTATTGSAAVGQAITGTNIPTGAFITGVVNNTSITINIPCTGSATNTMTFTTNSFNVNFEYSPDNSSWGAVSSIPHTLIQLRAPVSGTAQAGLYLVQAPITASGNCYLRFNITALSNCTLQLFCDAFTPGQRINLPLFYTGTQANWTSGACWIPPLDTSYLSSMVLDVLSFAGTGQTFTAYQSNDPYLGATQQTCVLVPAGTGSGVASNSFTSSGEYAMIPRARYIFGKETGSAITAGMAIGGFTAIVGSSDSSTITPTSQPINLANVGGNGAIAPSPQGASGVRSLGVNVTGAVNGTMTTTAFGGAGRINGAAQAFTADGGGTVMAFDVNLSTWTAGAASAIQFFIENSVDNGTTWNTIWTTNSVATTGHIYIPPLQIFGRVRMAANSIGGTSTTATTATNYMAYGGAPVHLRQHVDIYNATNPTTTLVNGATTTSTLVSTSLSTVSSVANIEGCKLVTISGLFTGGTPTTAPVYSLQVSNDNSNWLTTSCTFSPTAAGFFGATLANVCARYARLTITTASSGGTPYGVTFTQINGSN